MAKINNYADATKCVDKMVALAQKAEELQYLVNEMKQEISEFMKKECYTNICAKHGRVRITQVKEVQVIDYDKLIELSDTASKLAAQRMVFDEKLLYALAPTELKQLVSSTKPSKQTIYLFRNKTKEE